MDDGKDKQEHDRWLEAVLERIKAAGVMLNLSKCEFARSSLKFLGHIIDATGICADPDKNSAIVEMLAPTGIPELRRFLGMANQLAKFTWNLAELTQLLRDRLRKNNAWSWGSAQQELSNYTYQGGTVKEYTPLLCSRHESISGCIIFRPWSSATVKGVNDCAVLQPPSYISRRDGEKVWYSQGPLPWQTRCIIINNICKACYQLHHLHVQGLPLALPALDCQCRARPCAGALTDTHWRASPQVGVSWLVAHLTTLVEGVWLPPPSVQAPPSLAHARGVSVCTGDLALTYHWVGECMLTNIGTWSPL